MVLYGYICFYPLMSFSIFGKLLVDFRRLYAKIVENKETG